MPIPMESNTQKDSKQQCVLFWQLHQLQVPNDLISGQPKGELSLKQAIILEQNPFSMAQRPSEGSESPFTPNNFPDL